MCFCVYTCVFVYTCVCVCVCVFVCVCMCVSVHACIYSVCICICVYRYNVCIYKYNARVYIVCIYLTRVYACLYVYACVCVCVCIIVCVCVCIDMCTCWLTFFHPAFFHPAFFHPSLLKACSAYKQSPTSPSPPQTNGRPAPLSCRLSWGMKPVSLPHPTPRGPPLRSREVRQLQESSPEALSLP